MKVAMVIPTYWSRATDDPWQEGDAVYDHPTPIDGKDTLGRTLESIRHLDNKDFQLIIPVCPTTTDIESIAEDRVRRIVEASNPGVDTYIFTPKHLGQIREVLVADGIPQEATVLLTQRGYSNVRNICIYTASAIGADVAILIDDDEVFENTSYVDMAIEFIGKRIYGKSIYGVAGYYLNKYDEFYDDVDIVPWMTYWNRFGSKTKAFDKIIGCAPRLKVTPFAFGGAMVIHKNMFNMIPFDPNVTRGEDMDYLLNSKMFGFDFFLDNKLNVKHLPPKKNHPIWKRFREDIYRFLYEKSKIDNQYEVNNMHRVTAEDFDPYPGDFLKDDLEDKIFKTNVLLALEYLSEGDIEGCRESIRNAYLSKYEAVPKNDTFTEYRKIQKNWVKVIEGTVDKKDEIRSIIEATNINRVVYNIDLEKYESISTPIIEDTLYRIGYFDSFSKEELSELASISKMKAFNKNEVIFKEGEKDLALYFVIKGSVRIVKIDDKKDEIVLGRVEKDDVIGETFMTKEVYNSTGVAHEFVELLSMSKVDINQLIETNPQLGNKMLRLFLERIYLKLNKTNILYKESVENNEDVSSL
ncbi:MAG: cyclic nucleotide-binding domain-containing protein [Clostridia bacterium]|nr:cyclic nucleotide-binding domain-containing protein [Clostridia bacterium]